MDVKARLKMRGLIGLRISMKPWIALPESWPRRTKVHS